MAKDKAGVKHNIDAIITHINSSKTLLDELKGSESLSLRDEKLLDNMNSQCDVLRSGAESIQDLSDDYYKYLEARKKAKKEGGYIDGFDNFDINH